MANISTPITLLQVSNLDAKLCNWYVSGANIVVETIPEYLARVTINRRSPATLVAILLPKDGYTSLSPYSYASFKDILVNYDCKLYYFKEGLYDEDFVEFLSSDSTFDISIYFEEAADDFVYHCPFDMKITAYEYEDGVATFLPDFVLGEIVLNKYDTLTITSTTIGLIILKGELL